MSTAAVILAAGASKRLGRPKQLEPWGETNLLGHVVSQTKTFPVDEVWVVLGHEVERVITETPLEDVGIIENPEWEEGVASSLRVALDALTRLSRCERVLIVPANQPDLTREVVTELLESHVRSGKPVSIPKYRYAQGDPAVVERSLWARLMSLEGEDETTRLWKTHPEWINEVRFSEVAPREVDTEDDVTELRPRPIV